MTVLSNPVKIMGYVVTKLMVSSVNVSLATVVTTVRLILMNVQAIRVGRMERKHGCTSVSH